MANGLNDIFATVITVISTLATAGLGTWIFKVLQYRSDTDAGRALRRGERERTIISEYQKILDKKDDDMKGQRDDFGKVRESWMLETTNLRRLNQQYLIDMEAMRIRLEVLGKELLAYRSGAGFAQDALDAVIHTDGVGDIYWCNEAASLFFRTPIGKMYQMNVESLISNTYMEEHKKGMARVRARGQMARGDVDQTVIRGRAKLPDSSEIPVDVYISTFWINETMICRAQIRRNFDRPWTDTPQNYIPLIASASGMTKALAMPQDKGGADAGK